MDETTTNDEHEARRRFHFDFYHQWDSFTSGCNWRDFTFIQISGEWSHLTGQAEMTLTLLGLSVRAVYVHHMTTPFMEELKQRRDDVLSRRAHVVEHDPPGGSHAG